MDDALDTLITALQGYGFSPAQAQALAPRLWDVNVTSPNDAQFDQWIITQPEFEQRFPGLNEMRASGRATSPAEWVAYERAAAGMFRAAGLPAGYYDQPEDFGAFITNEVSVAELQQRVQMAEASVYDQMDVQAAALYGLTPGDLTAYLLDPTKAEPIVERKFRAVQSAKIASQTAFGQLNAAEAERVALATGSPEQARQGFTALAQGSEVYNPLDSGEQTITRDEQLGAQFEGNADAQEKIRRQAKRRSNAFEAGGAFSQGQRGYAGVG